MSMEQIAKRELTLYPDKCYFYCNAGLGDTMLTFAAADELVKKHKVKFMFLIKASHKVVADMYGIQNYLIIDTTVLKGFLEKNASPKIRGGKVFMGHPAAHPSLKKFFEPVKAQIATEKFVSWFHRFLGLEELELVKEPIYYPQPKQRLLDKLEPIASPDKIVLLSPEATSMVALPESFWEEIVENAKERGFVPVSNVIDKNRTIRGSKYVELNSEEAVSLALSCREIHSVRSGFCDLIYSRGKDLHVYYPTHSAYFLYCLNDMFQRSDIDERILSELFVRYEDISHLI